MNFIVSLRISLLFFLTQIGTGEGKEIKASSIFHKLNNISSTSSSIQKGTTTSLRGGGLIPAGYHPFGYKLTKLGSTFLSFEGSLESDIGRFLAGFKSSVNNGRKTYNTLKEQWLEIIRVAKTSQSLRIYKNLQHFINFSIEAGFLE